MCVLAAGSASRLGFVGSKSANICGNIISLSSVKYVGVHIDQTFSMQQHINNLCRASFLELRRIKSVCPSMFENATAILVLSTVISRLDYRSATFAGISSEQLLRLQQRILNHAARLVMKRSKTPLLKELHSASCAVSVSVQTGNPGVPLL